MHYSKTIAYLLCTIIALQSAVAVLLQNNQLSALKSMAPADVELICSGTDMKWISISQSQLQGQFVFVDPPTNTDEILAKHICPAGIVADQQHATGILSTPSNIAIVQATAYIIGLYQRPYTSFAYQTAQARSPPLLLS